MSEALCPSLAAPTTVTCFVIDIGAQIQALFLLLLLVVVLGAEEIEGSMSLRIKAVVDKFVQELKEALDADIQDRMMKEREMQSYIEEREREVAERESAWKAELSRREAEIARQEARLKMERENLEKEKSVLMGTASNQDNQDGALEITVSGEKYRCLRFAKAKK